MSKDNFSQENTPKDDTPTEVFRSSNADSDFDNSYEAETTEFTPINNVESNSYPSPPKCQNNTGYSYDSIADIGKAVDRLEKSPQNSQNTEEIYTIAHILLESVEGISNTNQDIINENGMLQGKVDGLQDRNNELIQQIDAMEAKNIPYGEQALEEKERQFESKNKINKNIIAGLSVVSIGLLLALGFTFSAYSQKKADVENSANRSVSQREQVRDMKKALDDAKKGQAGANSQVSDLQSQISDLNDRLDAANKDKDTARKNAKAQQEEIDNLNNQIDRLQNQEQRTETSTTTATATVTERQPSSDSRSDSSPTTQSNSESNSILP